MQPLHITKLLSSFILFFAFVFIAFYFVSSDKEYNLNQQVDRGYISRNAIFFAIDNPSYRTAVHYQFTPEEYNNLHEPPDLSPIPAEDPDYVMLNPVGADGYTRIESLLSSGTDDYFAAIHTGTGRGVYYKGNVMLPPISEGRFFTPEECLSREPLAVIGNSFLESVYTDTGTQYIDYQGQTYRVIGFAGLNHPSTLDHLIFVNLGSISPEDQLLGRYYIDSDRQTRTVFENMNEASVSLFDNPLVRLQVPETLTDMVSGGVYMKDYLKVFVALLFAFMYLSILTQSILQQNRMVAVMKIVGVSFRKIYIKAYLPLFISGLTGVLLGSSIATVLVVRRYFSLPDHTAFQTLITFSILGVILLILWTAVICLFDRRIHLREVTQKL